MDFFYARAIAGDVANAVSRLRSELQDQGFGVLWELDVPERLAAKGVNLNGEYRILEVCDPNDAKRALEANPLVGYFLPCKLVVYTDGGRTMVGMPRPTFLMSALGSQDLAELAERVESKLRSAIDAV